MVSHRYFATGGEGTQCHAICKKNENTNIPEQVQISLVVEFPRPSFRCNWSGHTRRKSLNGLKQPDRIDSYEVGLINSAEKL